MAQDILAAEGVRDALGGKVLASVLAGVTMAQLEAWAPGAEVVRAMTNTPAKVRRVERRRRAKRESLERPKGARLPAPQARIPERAVGRARIPASSSEASIPAPQARVPERSETPSSEARIPRATEGSETTSAAGKDPRARRRARENPCLVERQREYQRRRQGSRARRRARENPCLVERSENTSAAGKDRSRPS